MTLKEIAAQANVSVSTVSRVLNATHPKAASPEVRERIWAIARKEGYMPNTAAQSLRSSTKLQAPRPIGTIYCLVACFPEEVHNDPFFTQALASIEQEAFHNGYLLEYSFLTKEQENQFHFASLEKSTEKPLIVIGRFDADFYQQLKKKFKRIVYLCWNDLGFKCDGVICDGYQAAQAAVAYLYELGHRKIGFIGTNRTEARSRGYLQGLQNVGLEYDERRTVISPVLSYEFGYKSMEHLIEQGLDMTAVYCANDNTAIGALRACDHYHISVPEDLSVMGSNDVESTQYVAPMLTTIRIPLDEMGRIATKILIDRIGGGHSLPLKVMVPFQIVKRESCQPPKH